MCRYTGGNLRAIALALRSEMPDKDDAYYAGLEDTFTHDMETWTHMCQTFGNLFGHNNPEFDATTFYTQCGIERDLVLQMVQL